MDQRTPIVQRTEMRRRWLGTVLQLRRKQKTPDVAIQHVGSGPESIAILQQEHHRPLRVLLGRPGLRVRTA